MISVQHREGEPLGTHGGEISAPAAKKAALGIDLGGTKISTALIDENGTLSHSSYRAHDGTGRGAQTALLEVIELALTEYPLAAIGVAAAGLVDRQRGVLLNSALLGITDFPLADTVADRFGTRVLLENDANATLAGIQQAQPAGVEVLFALGTGVGGAISDNGTLLDGSFGFAAELGHIPVEGPGRHSCPCGSSGCLELFASGTAIARHAASAGLEGEDGRRPRAEDVVAAARAGHGAAAQLLISAGTALGAALSALVPVLDPSTAYIAGGFGHAAADFIIPAAKKRLHQQLPFPRSRPAPQVTLDPVGPLAAAIGAARLAHRGLDATP